MREREWALMMYWAWTTPSSPGDKLTCGPAGNVSNLWFAVLATGKNPGIVKKDDFQMSQCVLPAASEINTQYRDLLHLDVGDKGSPGGRPESARLARSTQDSRDPALLTCHLTPSPPMCVQEITSSAALAPSSSFQLQRGVASVLKEKPSDFLAACLST